jgi:hypothetical protein
MTTVLAERRKGNLFKLLLAAAALAAAAFVAVAIEARSSRPDLASGPVVPGLAERIAGAQRITVTSAEASYRIERTQRGWAMRDRGDFPVLATRLAQLTEGLQGLQYVRRMTSDPAKHERLGVGDPRQGGRGVMVQIEDGQGAFLVNLILGIEPNGLYVRRPDQNQTWAARGELPPLRDIAAWLELRPIALQGDEIARVEITPAEGGAYILARETPEAGDFTLVSPRVALAPGAVTPTALRITQLSPIDVQTAPAIQGPPRARVRVVTYDGVAIEGELIESDGKTWLKLVARAGAPEQEPAALEINNRAAGWAYALRQSDADALAPPLTTLLPPRLNEGAGPPAP